MFCYLNDYVRLKCKIYFMLLMGASTFKASKRIQYEFRKICKSSDIEKDNIWRYNQEKEKEKCFNISPFIDKKEFF